MGMKPAGYQFSSNILKYAAMPDCVFQTFHTWDLDASTQKGLVWKLRSLKPMKPTPPQDPAQLAAVFGMLINMNNGGNAMDSSGMGAAGSGM